MKRHQSNIFETNCCRVVSVSSRSCLSILIKSRCEKWQCEHPGRTLVRIFLYGICLCPIRETWSRCGRSAHCPLKIPCHFFLCDETRISSGVATGPAYNTNKSVVTHLPCPGFTFVWERPCCSDQWDTVDVTAWEFCDSLLIWVHSTGLCPFGPCACSFFPRGCDMLPSDSSSLTPKCSHVHIFNAHVFTYISTLHASYKHILVPICAHENLHMYTNITELLIHAMHTY